MIKVECPSCAAPYELDERRLPPSGLNMRCPKCGTSFPVKPPGAESAAPPPPAPAPPAPPAPPAISAPGARKKTMVGVGLSSASYDEIADLPAPAAAKKPLAPPFPGPAAPPSPKKPLAPPFPGGEIDLPAPVRAKPATDEFGLDLPAPVGAKPAADDFGLDLPALVGAKPAADDFGLDLPAPKTPSPAGNALDLDLPAPVGAKPAADDFGLDLPAPKTPAPGGGGFDLDLPAPKTPAPGGGGFDLDLPAPKTPAPGGGGFDLDLPAPKTPAPGGGGFDLDLPAPKTPAPGGGGFDLDLPAPAGDRADLPAPRASIGATPFDAWEAESGGAGELDLPAPAGPPDLDLPVPKAAGGFGDDLDLPMPKSVGGFGDDLDLPVSRGQSDLPVPSAPALGGGLELDLDGPGGGVDDFELGGFEPSGGGLADDADFGDLEIPSLPPPEPGGGGLDLRDDPMALDDDLSLPDPVERGGEEFDLGDDGQSSAGAGGTGFGELDLGGDDEGGLEFDEIPEESEGAAATAQRVSRVSQPSALPVEAPQKKGVAKALIAVAAVLVVIVGAGVGLSYTNYGLFGVFVAERFLPGSGDAAHVERVIAAAETQAQSDAYADVRASIGALGRERRTAGLNRTLLARSLLHESLYQHRFGEDTASQARARAIRGRLEERGDEAPGVEVALAAFALAEGEASQANRLITAALRTAPDDPYTHLVAAELALSRGDHEDAAAAFAVSVEHGGGARAQWGSARAAQAAGDNDAAATATQATLELSPGHVAARAARARQLWSDSLREQAVAMARQAGGLDPVGEAPLRGSAIDRATALTFLGEMYEALGRRAVATEMYDMAIQLNPFDLRALLGSGRGLLAEHRAADALTRFEAVVEAVETANANELAVAEGVRPLEVQAQFAAVEALLELERPQDARAILTGVLTTRPDDTMVHLWLGRTAQALDEEAGAIELFEKVIELDPTQFDGYNALAQLYFASDRLDDAAAILEQANDEVEVSAEVLRLRGESELRRGRLDQAVEQFQAAVDMDGNDTAARFGLGVTLRRAGRLVEAQAAFDALSEHDPSYPGLSLERGRIFEAQGLAARAVRAYETALEESPEDLDLMLRLGGAQVASGDIDAAEQTLRDVISRRPDSAEAEYFMGRVSFARDQLNEALTHFARSVQLDSTRPEYRVYLAWVCFERNDLGRAQSELRAAIERDDSLADAYWLRARLGVRTGAVRDALRDLERVLQLNPGRAEAYATRGDAYEQLGERREAIRSYRKAVEGEPTNGQFWYRFGRLQYDDGRRREAASALDRATSLGAAQDPSPRWLPEAYRLGGEVHEIGGERSAAIRDFQRYLELAGVDATDRPAVLRSLRRMGVTVEED